MTHRLLACACAFVLSLSFFGCGTAEEAPGTPRAVESPTQPPEPEAPPEAGPVDESWVAARVAQAHRRLAESAPGRLLREAIDAHGGLAAWYRTGTLELAFDYRPLADPAGRRATFQRLDLWRARAHHEELGDGADAVFGWDGEEAWIQPNAEAFPSPARFWALTPYYFVAIPFVLADEGARYVQLPDAELEGVAHRLVKVTYEAGTGDAPEDYYIVYLHPETHRVSALRYVVSYRGFFPDGGHTPEKLMHYRDLTETDGLWLPRALPTHRYDVEAGEVGERVTEITIDRVRFGQTYAGGLFSRPDGAVPSEL